MNTAEATQRLDIGVERIAKISAKAARLSLVKPKPREQIVSRFGQDLNPHEVRRCISDFASSQLMNFVALEAIFCSRSRNSSPCHAGDSTASGTADKLSQSDSIV
jgi:hypothetical protein